MKSTHPQFARELRTVPDDELLRRIAELLAGSRHAEADLVACIGEAEARRLYAREATPSMFVYWYDQTKADALSGRQTHRGKSQKPRSLDGSQEGN